MPNITPNSASPSSPKPITISKIPARDSGMSIGRVTKSKKRALALKEISFAKAYVAKKGNGSQAALQVYNTKNPAVAASIASRVLRKENVQLEIKALLDSEGLNLPNLNVAASKALHSGLGKQATNKDSVKMLEMLYKMHGAFPANKTLRASVDLTAPYKEMKYQEVLKELEKERDKSSKLLKDLGMK